MKAVIYSAPAVFNTWAKTGYLFENSLFICQFKYFNMDYFICRKYDFLNPPTNIYWGKGVCGNSSDSQNLGAFTEYQTFEKGDLVEVNFESFVNYIKGKNFKLWKEPVSVDLFNFLEINE